MSRRLRFIGIVLILLSMLLFGCDSDNPKLIIENHENPKLNKEVIIPNSKEIIEKLSSDEFEGRFIRDNGPGNKLAEKYIYDIFSNLQLEPFLKNDYYHNYDYDDTDEFDSRIIVKKSANNLVGKISGLKNKNAIVISAHFDHIGIQNGKLIRGSIDNASGVAVLVNLANKLKSNSKTNPFNYDIIFASFNGEEVGLTGSKNFVNEIKGIYEKVYNVNIDSVGYKEGGNIVLVSSFNSMNNTPSTTEYNKLYDNIKKSFEDNNIGITYKNTYFLGSDDYSFQEKGYTAMSIMEEGVKKIIHTEKDTPEMINYSKLESVEKSVYDFIINFGDSLFQ